MLHHFACCVFSQCEVPESLGVSSNPTIQYGSQPPASDQTLTTNTPAGSPLLQDNSKIVSQFSSWINNTGLFKGLLFYHQVGVWKAITSHLKIVNSVPCMLIEPTNRWADTANIHWGGQCHVWEYGLVQCQNMGCISLYEGDELIEEIKMVREERKQLEWTRQELLRKGKDLLAQNRNRRNQGQ